MWCLKVTEACNCNLMSRDRFHAPLVRNYIGLSHFIMGLLFKKYIFFPKRDMLLVGSKTKGFNKLNSETPSFFKDAKKSVIIIRSSPPGIGYIYLASEAKLALLLLFS